MHMNDIMAVIAGLFFGLPIGVLIVYWRQFGTLGRAWCRLFHRHSGQWRTTRYGERDCESCGRHWHRTY